MIGVATSESITRIAPVPGQYLHIHPCLVTAELMFVMFRCSELTFSASHNPNISDKIFYEFGHSDTSLLLFSTSLSEEVYTTEGEGVLFSV